MEMSEANREYQIAGEIFGRLRKALGFGELLMFTRTCDAVSLPQTVAYRWEFKIGKRRYFSQEDIPFIKLGTLRSTEAFSQSLAEKWKYEHRKATK